MVSNSALPLNLNIIGFINDKPIKGKAQASYEAPGISNGVIEIEELPPTFDALAVSCTSVISWSHSIYSPAINGAQNLANIFLNDDQGYFEVEMEHQIFSDKGLLGLITQKAWCKITIDERIGEVELKGYYNGPTGVKYSPGYIVYLTQNKNIISGKYSQLMILKDNSTIVSKVKRIYKYNTDKHLPFDTLWIYRIRYLENNLDPLKKRQIARFKAQAHFEPALNLLSYIELT
ncbi:MAG: hypothetical protein ACP5OK_08730 [Thermoprotei archaeon]